jgi:YD repeat-containing protein
VERNAERSAATPGDTEDAASRMRWKTSWTSSSLRPSGTATACSPSWESEIQYGEGEGLPALMPVHHRAEAPTTPCRSSCVLFGQFPPFRDFASNYSVSYDDVGRLTQAERDGTITDYEYDANGNRSRVTIDGVETATGAYDAQDRIQSYGTATFEQTAQGDLLRRTDGSSTLELAYDELGNLQKAVISDGSKTKTLKYSVDGFGRRVAKNDNGRVTSAVSNLKT